MGSASLESCSADVRLPVQLSDAFSELGCPPVVGDRTTVRMPYEVQGLVCPNARGQGPVSHSRITELDNCPE